MSNSNPADNDSLSEYSVALNALFHLEQQHTGASAIAARVLLSCSLPDLYPVCFLDLKRLDSYYLKAALTCIHGSVVNDFKPEYQLKGGINRFVSLQERWPELRRAKPRRQISKPLRHIAAH